MLKILGTQVSKFCQLTPELIKAQVNMLSFSVNFSHFHVLLKNQWANFNQTCHKASLGEGGSSLLK